MSERTPREWLLAVEQYPLRGGVSTDFEAALAAWRADRNRIRELEEELQSLKKEYAVHIIMKEKVAALADAIDNMILDEENTNGSR